MEDEAKILSIITPTGSIEMAMVTRAQYDLWYGAYQKWEKIKTLNDTWTLRESLEWIKHIFNGSN